MPIFRKKAGPEFEAMEFDGSFESAKSILAWMGSDFSYWSSNQTMTIRNYTDGDCRLIPGDRLAKLNGDYGQFIKISKSDFADYEVVA